MTFSTLFLKGANALVSFVVAVFLIVAGTYSVYALWDNEQIYAAAYNVQADMIKLKPKITVTESEDEEEESEEY